MWVFFNSFKVFFYNMDVDFALILMTRDTQHTLTKVTSSKLRNTYFSYICFFTRREVKLKNLMTHSREWIATNHFPSTATNTHYIPLLKPHTQLLLVPCWVLESQVISMRKNKFLCQQSHKNRHKFSFLTSHQRIQILTYFFSFAVVISK